MKERFEEKFIPEPNSGCWIWNAGFLGTSGYGSFSVKNKTYLAHRISFQIYNGEIAKGMCVMHSCDTPCCVNPRHLKLGTLKDNSQDKMMKGRCWQANKTHCPQGHPYSAENTAINIWKRNGNRARYCKTCNRLRVKKYYRKDGTNEKNS